MRRRCTMAQPQVPEVPRLPVRPPVEDFDVSQRSDVAKLRKGAIGLGGVLFLTVTGSAPISAMLFNTPIVVGYASVVAYSVFEASLAGGFAYFLSLKLNQFGVNIAWPWLALAMVLIISLLTYFDVRISSMVLAVGLISEVVILLIFDVFLFARGHVTAAPLNPVNAFKSFPAEGKLAAGAVGIGLFFAFWSWVGFEMAPNYGEESRDPKRIVPRALYISVIGLGIFYTLTAWAPLGGYPSTHAAIHQAQTAPYNYYLQPANQYAGHWVAVLLSYLIITGSFACGMAFHNTTARYFYSLGREGLLPKALGRTHPRFKSPHIASIVQSIIAAGIVILFAVVTGTDDPTQQAYLQLYGLMAVMGVIVILSVQALVSLAILVYFFRYHRDEVHWWKTGLAPLLALVSQAFVVYLLFDNISTIAGKYPLVKWLGPIDLAVVLIGVGAAFYFKARKPAKYEQAGRLINEGL